MTCMRAIRQCCGCDRGAHGGGETASRFSFEPLLLAVVMDRLTDEVRQETPCLQMTLRCVVSNGKGAGGRKIKVKGCPEKERNEVWLPRDRIHVCK